MTFTPRPPVSDDDTYDVPGDGVTILAERRGGLWLGDDLALIHLLASLIDQAERWLPYAVLGARDNGASWHDIATLLATSPGEAQLRFDSVIADGRWPWRYPGDDDAPGNDPLGDDAFKIAVSTDARSWAHHVHTHREVADGPP